MKASLIEKYTEPHRKYHNLEHIDQMFTLASDLTLQLNKSQTLAILYHDSIYDPTSSINEENSCEFMYRDSPEEDRMDLDIAEYIILKTKTHKKTQLRSADLVLDLDMSCLGFERTEYLDKYSKLVIQEYCQFFQFSKVLEGRKKFLEGLLKSEIFITDLFKTKFEKIARENLRAELEILNSNPESMLH
jgi:predicted metal-dependent HD superfamily phosphohydrolase